MSQRPSNACTLALDDFERSKKQGKRGRCSAVMNVLARLVEAIEPRFSSGKHGIWNY